MLMTDNAVVPCGVMMSEEEVEGGKKTKMAAAAKS